MEFRQKYLYGESFATNDTHDLLNGHFDLLVVAPSWDSRSVVITEARKFSADDCIVLDSLAGISLATETEMNNVYLSSHGPAVPV